MAASNKEQTPKHTSPNTKSKTLTSTFTKKQDEILYSIHNEAIVSDCFWLFFCKEYKLGPNADKSTQLQYNEVAENCLDRIAAHFVSFFVNYIQLDKDKNPSKTLFFKEYYDVVAQAVFFAFYFAYPKSRPRFTTQTISHILSYFSKLFNGIEDKRGEFQHWTLNSGSEDIIKSLISRNKKAEIRYIKADSNTRKEGIKYSELFQRYLKNHKYKMINCIKPLNMKISQSQEIKEKRDFKFKSLKIAAEKANMAAEESKTKCELEKMNCVKAIKAIKYNSN